MRNAFIDELLKAAKRNDKIMLVVGDLGYGVVNKFAEELPNQFINAGVAEQNMMGLAAGLASEGYHVFVYSIANFPTFRCAEQIRNDVAYHNLPVTVVAVGGGLAYGSLGYSHHAVQDYGLVRLFPNMKIYAPCDPYEVVGCMSALLSNPGPSYLRLGKAGEPCVHAKVPLINGGEWIPLRRAAQPTSKAVVSTGAAIMYALNYASNSCDIYTLPLWGMGLKHTQLAQIEAYEEVVTFEDHLYDAGFGSWMRESAGNNQDILKRITNMALDPVVCGEVGCQEALNRLGGLKSND